MLNFQHIRSSTMDQNLIVARRISISIMNVFWWATLKRQWIRGRTVSRTPELVRWRKKWVAFLALHLQSSGKTSWRKHGNETSESQLTILGITFLDGVHHWRGDYAVKTYRTFPQSLFQLSRRRLANCHCVRLSTDSVFSAVLRW